MSAITPEFLDIFSSDLEKTLPADKRAAFRAETHGILKNMHTLTSRLDQSAHEISLQQRRILVDAGNQLHNAAERQSRKPVVVDLSALKDDQLIRFPRNTELKKCLTADPRMKDPYLTEKKVIDNAVRFFTSETKTPLGVEMGAMLVLDESHLPNSAVQLNLTTALHSCAIKE